MGERYVQKAGRKKERRVYPAARVHPLRYFPQKVDRKRADERGEGARSNPRQCRVEYQVICILGERGISGEQIRDTHYGSEHDEIEVRRERRGEQPSEGRGMKSGEPYEMPQRRTAKAAAAIQKIGCFRSGVYGVIRVYYHSVWSNFIFDGPFLRP